MSDQRGDLQFPLKRVAAALDMDSLKPMNMPCPIPTPETSRPLAAFDLDDTLNLLTEEVCAVMKQYGIHVDYEEILHFDWHKTYGADAPCLDEFFCNHPLLERALPNPEGLTLVRRLLNEGWDVEVWTARAWHPRGEFITRQWLNRYGLKDVRARLCDHRECKTTLIAGGRIPDLYVDDAPHHVMAMAEAGSKMSTLISRPWNRGVTVPWRVHCLSEVELMALPRIGESMEPC